MGEMLKFFSVPHLTSHRIKGKAEILEEGRLEIESMPLCMLVAPGLGAFDDEGALAVRVDPDLRHHEF